MDNVLWLIGLLVATLVLLSLELLTPMFGLFIVTAVLAAGGAVWLSFTISAVLGWIVLVGVVVGVPLYLRFLVRRLPNSKLGRGLFLAAAADATGTGQPDAGELSQLVGKTGEVIATLRPAGVIRIEGKRVEAMAEGTQIERGTAVKVIRFDGMDAIVRPVEE